MDNLGKTPVNSESKSSGKMRASKSSAKTTAVKTETAPTITHKPISRKLAAQNTPAPAGQIDEQQRRGMIAVAAYLRAEQRGFRGGDPTSDWLEAEAEIELRLKQR